MSLALVTAPTVEPVTLAEALAQLRVTAHTEDAYFSGLLKSARVYCESYLRRAFCNSTWRWKLDGFAGDFYEQQDGCLVSNPRWVDEAFGELRVPLPPLQSVSSITYYDASNTSQTLSTSVYEVDTDSAPGRIRLKTAQMWPATYYRRQAVTVTFVAGYGGPSATDAQSQAAVPQNVKQAILLLASHWNEQREASGEVDMKNIPYGVEALLAPEAWGSYV